MTTTEGEPMNEKSRDKTVTLKLEIWRELKKLSADLDLSLSQTVDLLLKMKSERERDDARGSAGNAGKTGGGDRS